jgi:hypothetical protein
VHSARLEHWDRGLTACSGEVVAVHWVEVLVAEASAFGSLGIAPRNPVATSGMEGTDPASTGKPCLGF